MLLFVSAKTDKKFIHLCFHGESAQRVMIWNSIKHYSCRFRVLSFSCDLTSQTWWNSEGWYESLLCLPLGWKVGHKELTEDHKLCDFKSINSFTWVWDRKSKWSCQGQALWCSWQETGLLLFQLLPAAGSWLVSVQSLPVVTPPPLCLWILFPSPYFI